jgi:hypothetical protein
MADVRFLIADDHDFLRRGLPPQSSPKRFSSGPLQWKQKPWELRYDRTKKGGQVKWTMHIRAKVFVMLIQLFLTK